MQLCAFLLCALLLLASASSLELHVATTGDDANDGSAQRPFRTVQHAATQSQPGDTVTVHAGVYRERVHPSTSGVVFQAAPGDAVTISGSDPVTGWSRVANTTGTYFVVLPSYATFGNFNPYMDHIFGDWFGANGLLHHTGSVYFGEAWLDEAPSLAAVLSPLAPGAAPRWFATVDGDAGAYLVNLLWIAPRGAAAVSAGQPSWRYGSKPYNSSAGPCAAFILPGNVLRFDNLDFGAGASALDLSAAAATGAGAVLEVRAGDRWGALLGTAAVASTGDWERWANFSVPITPTSGLQNITIVFLPPGYHEGNTIIYAQVPPGTDPNAASEIHVRQTVFYPSTPYVDNVTVRGFTLERAATQWAPPSSEQVGIIGTHWSKGWVIEGNEVRYSRCSCVSLGKYGDGTDNTNDQGQADPYTACVYRALENGWHKEFVGSHTVRQNHIHHCGQTGVVGSMGGAFSSILGNDIHDCNTGQTFAGAEMACIKLHAAVDVVIQDNHLHNCSAFGIWLDWMAQGTMVLANLIHSTRNCGIFTEVDHGPATIANNIFLPPDSGVCHDSAGNAYAHNLIAGAVENHGPDARRTPALVPHQTDIAAVVRAVNGDHRVYNNLLAGPAGFAPFDSDFLPCAGAGNVYTGAATPGPSKYESGAVVNKTWDAAVTLTEAGGVWTLQLSTDPGWAAQQARAQVNTALLGVANLTAQPFTLPDGSPFALATDYFGRPRSANPFPGPFEASGELRVQVWPKPQHIPHLKAEVVTLNAGERFRVCVENLSNRKLFLRTLTVDGIKVDPAFGSTLHPFDTKVYEGFRTYSGSRDYSVTPFVVQSIPIVEAGGLRAIAATATSGVGEVRWTLKTYDGMGEPSTSTLRATPPSSSAPAPAEASKPKGKGALLQGSCVRAPGSRVTGSFSYTHKSVIGEYIGSGTLLYKDRSAVLLLLDGAGAGSGGGGAGAGAGAGAGGASRKSQRHADEEVRVLEEEEEEKEGCGAGGSKPAPKKARADLFTESMRKAWGEKCPITLTELKDEETLSVMECCSKALSVRGWDSYKESTASAGETRCPCCRRPGAKAFSVRRKDIF